MKGTVEMSWAVWGVDAGEGEDGERAGFLSMGLGGGCPMLPAGVDVLVD